ncbi:MAG: hypothetical protein K6B46_03070 [Opitutales bacterium]|nr:hypothetical protein [Opitutales bacterium]
MKAHKLFLGTVALVALAAGTYFVHKKVTDREVIIEEIASLDTGCGQGVAGAVGGALADGGAFVLGGCNFPEAGPADGGKKHFYGSVWLLDNLKGDWRERQNFELPLAYGAAAATTAGTVIMGGCNEKGSVSKVTVYKSEEDFGANAEDLPPLPGPLDNFAAAAIDDWVFVAGGNAAGKASKSAWVLRLDRIEDGWQPLPDFPGTPRLQPAAVCVKTNRGNAFVLIGGYSVDPESKEAILPRDAVAYYVDELSWETLPALGDNVSEAGLVGAAATVNPRGQIVVLGGVNAKIFKNAVEGKYGSDYLRHEPQWYRFNGDILLLSLGKVEPWSCIDNIPQTARAGATLIKLEDRDSSYLYVNGESMPGVRSTDVLKINFKKGY